MLARIIDNHTIQFEQITTPEELELKKRFSVQSLKAKYLDISDSSAFDGWYRKYREGSRTLSRAFLAEVRKLCVEKQLPLTVLDDRPPPKRLPPDPVLVTPDMLPGITLEEYQLRLIRATCYAEVGLLESPTGSGKGEIIAAITKIHACPTVIIAEQSVVIEELCDRLKLRKIIDEPGVFMAGKMPSGQSVLIGLIQSLYAPTVQPKKTQKDTPESYAKKLQGFKTRLRNARALRKLIAQCDLLLIDEADRATNAQYRNLVRFWFKGRRRYGLSGTFFDPAKPVQNLVLQENLGSILAKATREEVQSKGRIVPVALAAIAFGDPVRRHEKTAYDIAQKENLIENEKFHDLLIRMVKMCTARAPDHGVVILCESIPLGEILEEKINLADPSLQANFIYGMTTKKKRREAIEAFQRRESRVLIGSKIVRRGMDLKGGTENLIIATAGKLQSEFNQMVGRSVRLNKLGFCWIYDIFHLNNFYLYAHSRLRLKHMVGMGYAAKVKFKWATVEATAFIRSRFRIPRER